MAALHRSYLEPARRWLGGPLRVTSFIRAGSSLGSGAHAGGLAVDVVPSVAPGAVVSHAKLRGLAHYLWGRLGSHLGQVIWSDEPGNIHLHLVLAGGVEASRQGVLYSPDVGVYHRDSGAPERGSSGVFDEASRGALLAFGVALVALHKGAR